MIASRPFTIPTEGTLAAMIASVLTTGTPAFVVLALAATVAEAYLINPAPVVLVASCTQLATLYRASDSAVRLLILCMLGYVLVKLFASLKRSLAALCRK